MPAATAFLSYTHTDDEFFGGYITAFRKALELGVQVVTGEQAFRIFQDIDGLVIGDQWQKKLDDALEASSLFIPMLSPLFFNSVACRNEVEVFLEHERKLGRADLILPVYFIESGKLAKPEETAKDPIATTIAARQWFDWRQRAKLPLQDPAARDSILELSRAVEKALPRVEAPAVTPSTRARGMTIAETHRDGLEAASRAGTIDASTGRGEPSRRNVLWVDDNPDYNVWERHALESYGMHFVLATGTDEALDHLAREKFDAIISDMGRRDDSEAGFTLLDGVRRTGIDAPYFIYCGRQAPFIRRDAERRGARGVTNDPDELVEMVVEATR